MKISRQKIRRMILERMALIEHRTMPDASAIPPQHLDTIHDIIDHGDLAQAQSLVDALGGSPTYVQDYLEYQNVGDMEKLGNRAADILPDSPEEFAARDFMKTDDWKKVRDVDREAYSLSQDKAVEIEGGQEYYNPDAQDIALDRYRGNRDRYIDDESDPDEFLFEHLTAPPVPTNIPLHHLHKIQDLIDGGEIEMARSLIDALGGPVDYIDDYILYSKVGDMEKLGNQAYDARSSYDRDSLELTNALKNIDREAVGIAHKRGQMIDGDAHSIFGGSGSFQSDMRRYVGNRDRPLSEHRVRPSSYGIPPQHLDKIHDLINKGEFDQAQSFVDAFEGDPNYVENYRAYEEVGDLEKLGNARADILDNFDFSDDIEWYESDEYRQINDLDRQAYSLGADKVARGVSPVEPGDVTRKHPSYSYMNNRYRDMRSVKPLNEHNSSRAGLRRMILQEMADMGVVPGQKVVELDLGSAFFLRHPELEGGEIVVDEMDEVAGALVALKGMGFTHVFSRESEVTEPIGATIQYFDEGDFQYAEHYGDVSHDALVDDMDMDFGGSYDEDSEDDDWI